MNTEINFFNIKINIAGNKEDAHLAEMMLHDLVERSSIADTSPSDIEKVIKNDSKHLVVYKFKTPFDAEDFKKSLGESKGIVWAIYGNEETLDDEQLKLIWKTLDECCPNNIGMHYGGEKDDLIKIIALV